MFVPAIIRVQEDAANKPNASQNYELSGTATTGNRTFAAAKTASEIADEDELIVLAEQIDANGNPAGAWEVVSVLYDDLATDLLKTRTLIKSSSGALIDWSTATGIDKTPRLTAISLATRQPVAAKTTSASSSASLDFSLRANCDYLLIYEGLDLQTDGVDVQFRVSTDGVTFDSGAGAYSWSFQYVTAAANAVAGNASATEMRISNSLFGNAGVDEEISGYVWILGANTAGTYTRILGAYQTQSSADTNFFATHGGQRLAAQADVAIRIAATSGNLDAGNFTLYEFPRAG